MRRRVMKHDWVSRIAQKSRSALLTFQNSALAFHAQIDVQIAFSRHQPYQRLRLMDVEIVHRKLYARRAERERDRLADVGGKIGLGASRPTRPGDDLPSH